MIPVFIYFLLSPRFDFRVYALLIFIAASITDFLDGYLARKLRQDSKLGRFLDPLADKFLVVATLIAFLILDSLIPIWMVIVIIARDMLITAMRWLGIRKGQELKTTRLGKAKTVFQMFSIIIITMIFIVRSVNVDISKSYDQGLLEGKKHSTIAFEILSTAFSNNETTNERKKPKREIFAESVPYFLMLLTTLITMLSGFRYVYSNYQILLPPYRRPAAYEN